MTETPANHERAIPNSITFLSEINGLTARIAIRPTLIETIKLSNGTCLLAYAANKNVYIFTGRIPFYETGQLLAQPCIDMDANGFKLQATEQIGFSFEGMHSLTASFLLDQDKQLSRQTPV